MAKKSFAKKTQQQQGPEPASQIITGIVLRRIFYNSENGYCVLSVRLSNGNGNDEEIKATGNMLSVREGDEYEFVGQYIAHPKFGSQFKFSEARILLQSGAAGLARYLSGVTAGVGVKKAERIVAQLGEDAMQKIKDDPSVLNNLDFLTASQRSDIANDLSINSVQAELAGIICRPGAGIGMGTVAKIMAKYGQEAVSVIKENPYILSEELWGVGFIKADTIAQTAGIALDSPHRIEAAVNYVLHEAGNEGHVYLRPRDIIAKTIGRKGIIEASGIETADIARANQVLIDSGRCVRQGDCVYATSLYEAEQTTAAAIRRLIRINTGIPTNENIESLIDAAQGDLPFSQSQRQAIKTGLASSLSIITGPPGSGKSFTLLGITEIYKKLYPKNPIYLCAPTGRAAKRMKEATGLSATTIHRLLAYSPMDGFRHNSHNPLPGPGLLIADESSMIDISLAASLFSAIEGDIKVILVGDVDQLPSVGPGSVLRDIIKSGAVPTTRLDYNYRQAGGSKIAEYANMICQGLFPPLVSAGDFEFIAVEDAVQAKMAVSDLTRSIIKSGYGPLDFAVIAPMHRGECGVASLNEMVREIVNPTDMAAGAVPQLPGKYRIRDKVMVIKNNYTLGVFNGDTGVVEQIDRGSTLVNFGDGQKVEFGMGDMDLLTLAYASTVHKYQGQESPVVIMTLLKQHYMLLQRNLLYTGMTRAKRKLYLIADDYSLRRAVKNNVIEERFSRLAGRICEKEEA